MRALALLVLLGLTAPALAQEQATAAPAPQAEPSSIDATKLGVSLSRIRKGLRTAETKEASTRNGLRIEFQVQVYGTAPRIELFKGVDLVGGAVPGSAPTHGQMVDFLTPKAFSAPALPVSAFAALAADWLWQKSKRTRCEEEIASYRALIMQGVSVSAPRCTQ